MKNINVFYLKNFLFFFFFLVVKFSIYLNRRGFVMGKYEHNTLAQRLLMPLHQSLHALLPVTNEQ